MKSKIRSGYLVSRGTLLPSTQLSCSGTLSGGVVCSSAGDWPATGAELPVGGLICRDEFRVCPAWCVEPEIGGELLLRPAGGEGVAQEAGWSRDDWIVALQTEGKHGWRVSFLLCIYCILTDQPAIEHCKLVLFQTLNEKRQRPIFTFYWQHFRWRRRSGLSIWTKNIQLFSVL